MRFPLPIRTAVIAMLLLLAGSAAIAQDPGASPDPSGTPVPQLPDDRIAVILEAGTPDDAGVNQAVVAGARTAAKAVGAPEPKVVVLKSRDAFASTVEGLIDDDATIIVTAGDLGRETAQAAADTRRVRFIGIDQPPPCLTLEGLPDTTGACPGDAAALLDDYTAISFREDQAGYLAGMIAASASPNGRIGMIGAIPSCDWCVRYMQGFEMGARAVSPDVQVDRVFVTDTSQGVAFDDPATGRAVAEAFIDVYQPDVVLAVAEGTGNGVMDAACAAGILAVGVDVDQTFAYPRARGCLLASATKGLARATSEAIIGIATETTAGGADVWDAARDGIGFTLSEDMAPRVPPELPDQLAKAYAQMQAGTLRTCPEDCGSYE